MTVEAIIAQIGLVGLVGYLALFAIARPLVICLPWRQHRTKRAWQNAVRRWHGPAPMLLALLVTICLAWPLMHSPVPLTTQAFVVLLPIREAVLALRTRSR